MNSPTPLDSAVHKSSCLIVCIFFNAGLDLCEAEEQIALTDTRVLEVMEKSGEKKRSRPMNKVRKTRTKAKNLSAKGVRKQVGVYPEPTE